MKAVFFPEKAKNNASTMDKKETVQTLRAVIAQKDKLIELVDARLYMGRSSRASTVYCSVWIHAKGIYVSGYGTASGYGYHKASAALASALSAAGFEFYGSTYGEPRKWNYDEQREYTAKELAAIRRKQNKSRCHFGGVGDSAMRDAVLAAGQELKKKAGLSGRVFVV